MYFIVEPDLFTCENPRKLKVDCYAFRLVSGSNTRHGYLRFHGKIRFAKGLRSLGIVDLNSDLVFPSLP